MTVPEDDRWAALRRLTPARVALGRAGPSLPTSEVLRFGIAHAQARDAVHAALDAPGLATALAGHGLDSLTVTSQAADRASYLRRPDLGRSLNPADRDRLAAHAGNADLALVFGDGLSATAVASHAAPFVAALLPRLVAQGLTLAPVVIALQARVALGDQIATALGVRAVAMLIGERPGLSSPDSLGAYLTYAPGAATTDADRNCISNIRPGGQAPETAAGRLAWLLTEAFRRRLTGVALKDDSDAALPGPAMAGNLPDPAA